MSSEEQAPETASRHPIDVRADFSAPVDYPLSKTKFAVFNSGLVPPATYRRDQALFGEVRPESLRIDLAWGWGPELSAWAVQPVAGTAQDPEYNFAEMDEVARLLLEQEVLPYWSYCYMPLPLQREGDWRSAPTDVGAWGRALEAYARHAREAGIHIGYHEVYNEPDLFDAPSGTRVFFTGTLSDYLEMYREGVRGIRAGDPDAVVGGAALSLIPNHSWHRPFLEFVRENDLPIDFFSFHHYESHTLERRLTAVRAVFAGGLAFPTTELHLNEYNSYPIDYPRGGTQDRAPLATALLEDFAYLLAQPEVTKVSWAQFLDSGHDNYSGMVTIDGHRKAVFNAYRIYSLMPVDRYRAIVDTPAVVHCMASSDGHTAGLVIWNRSDTGQDLRVHLDQVPFNTGTLRLYRVDADHASWTDNPTTEELVAVEARSFDGTRDLTWCGNLPANGVVYLELHDGSGISDADPIAVGRVLRTHQFYPDRGKTCYAEFDRRTWIARLGMGSEQEATALVGATVDHLPALLDVSCRVDDPSEPPRRDTLLGLRVDFQVDGQYTSSVLFNVGESEAAIDSAIPWGTARPADQLVRVLDASFAVRIAELAPAHWSGRAQLSFVLRNAGRGARAKFSIHPGDPKHGAPRPASGS
ncbi:MAG: glycoside hydrolase family 39 [Chloroflexi bacterium]|nr:glycoside hydrolase family 39 [Chloroflexota bacterium]